MSDELDGLDDLLSDGPSMTFASPELIAAGETLAQRIWEAGSEAWGVLLARGVMYTADDTEYNEPGQVIPAEQGECVVTRVAWTGDREGTFSLVVPSLGARTVVAYMMALMLGSDANPEETKLDDEGLDAYTEAVNQLVGAVGQALRQDPGGEVSLKVTSTEVVDFVATTPAMVFGTDMCICSTGQLTVEGAAPSTVYLLLESPLTGMETAVPTHPSDVADAVEAPPAPAAAAPEASGPIDEKRAKKIKLPVQVTLAEKQERLNIIMNLVPGSIIEFRKSAEELLDLRVGHITVARGEAVIVDEHFGLQIRRMADVKQELARLHEA